LLLHVTTESEHVAHNSASPKHRLVSILDWAVLNGLHEFVASQQLAGRCSLETS